MSRFRASEAEQGARWRAQSAVPYGAGCGANDWSVNGEAFGTCMTMKPRPIPLWPDLIELVGRKLPVRELACEPELDMPQLDFAHDVTERRPVGVLLGDGERCQDEAHNKSTNHGEIFHFCAPLSQRLDHRDMRLISIYRE
jgi:hypothetical protein